MSDLVPLLESLRSFWVAQAAPIHSKLQPGLGDAEMDALAAEYELSLSGELRQWWGWRNGVAAAAGRPARSINGHFEFLPMQDALLKYQEVRGWFASTDLTLTNDYRTTWVPIAQSIGREMILAETDSSELESCIYVRAFDDDESLGPDAASLADMVRIWLANFESGRTSYDAERGTWRLPDARSGDSLLV